MELLWWMNNIVCCSYNGYFTCIYNSTIDSVQEIRLGVKVGITKDFSFEGIQIIKLS